jgi:hypothetical protein
VEQDRVGRRDTCSELLSYAMDARSKSCGHFKISKTSADRCNEGSDYQSSVRLLISLVEVCTLSFDNVRSRQRTYPYASLTTTSASDDREAL